MRCDFAVQAPLAACAAGSYKGGKAPFRGIAHRTQGSTYAGAFATYKKNGFGPHFTIDTNGTLYQHVDTGTASSAMANLAGGVETNRHNAIQVELVGFSGENAPEAQLVTFVRLQRWCEQHHGIPLTWPCGRPPKDAKTGYGLKNLGEASNEFWLANGGWYGHSQVPENTHWDPAWTDQDWDFICRESGLYAPAPPSVTPDPDTEAVNVDDIIIYEDDSDRWWFYNARLGTVAQCSGATAANWVSAGAKRVLKVDTAFANQLLAASVVKS